MFHATNERFGLMVLDTLSILFINESQIGVNKGPKSDQNRNHLSCFMAIICVLVMDIYEIVSQ